MNSQRCFNISRSGPSHAGAVRRVHRNATRRVPGLRWCDLDFDRSPSHSSDSGGSEEERFDQGAEDGAEPKDDRPARDHRAGAKGSSQSASRTFASNSGAVGSSWVFPTWDGKLMNPRHFTKAFSREVMAAKISHVTFHGLRHTHITHLLRSGVPVHVVSERAGHANPT